MPAQTTHTQRERERERDRDRDRDRDRECVKEGGERGRGPEGGAPLVAGASEPETEL